MSVTCKCLYDKLKRFSDKTDVPNKYCDFFQEIHYYAIKILAITIQKMSNISGLAIKKVHLKKKQLAEIFDLSFFFLCNLKEDTIDLSVTNSLTMSFNCKNESDAISLFNSLLKEKTFNDSYGKKIFVPAKSVRHMYKDSTTRKHTISSSFFELYRGKRLSLIAPTIKSKVIISKYDDFHRKTARIYITKFREIYHAGCNEYFFVVVTHGSNKDGFNFTTAYKVDKVNQIIKIIQGHEAIKN